MYRFRHLLHAFAVVIVMIAASALSSVAHAHSGHDHGSLSSSTVAESVDAVPYQAALGVEDREAPAVTVVAAGSDDTNSRHGRCNGACCTSGMCCCASATVTETLAFSVPVLTSTALALTGLPAPAGIIPEALPKPPRSFA